MKNNALTLAEYIINGFEISENERNLLLKFNLKELIIGANKIRKFFIGDFVEMCCIINAKSGKCTENCKFCAQSIYNKATSCQNYDFLDKDEIIKIAKKYAKNDVHCLSLVTAGKKLNEPEFSKALNVLKILKQKFKFKLCCSMGFLSSNQLQQLKNVGVSTYHCNIETSSDNFVNVCTTHTFKMKIDMLKLIKKHNFRLCSGVIIGMGETFDDRFNMAMILKKLKADSIPINVLIPISGTPFYNFKILNEKDILKTIAIFRYINPKAHIRLAAGRTNLTNFGELAFKAGASSMIVGNMLTTSINQTIISDKNMLKNLNRIF